MTVVLLTIERLKTFSDAVLLVAITILAYNLVPPSVINGQLSADEVENFLDNLLGLISSFFVITIFWVLCTIILDSLKESDPTVVLTLMIFFILVLLTPVYSVAQVQYETVRSVITFDLLEITNSLLLMLLWTYIIKYKTGLLVKEEEGQLTETSKNRLIYGSLTAIISVYSISIGIAFIDITIAGLIPVIMISTVIWLARGLTSQKTN